MHYKPKKEPKALFFKDEMLPVAWACGTCGRVHSREAINTCCAIATCDCGKEGEQGRVICKACIAKKEAKKFSAQIDKAEKLNPKDYAGPVFYEPTEQYYPTIEDAWDNIYNEDEERLFEDRAGVTFWACHVEPFSLDANDIINSALEDYYKDTEINTRACAGLQNLLEEWVSENSGGIESWEQDTSRQIVIPDSWWEEYAKEWVKIREEDKDATGE